MADPYYDALIAVWPSVPGKDANEKLTNLNAMTVPVPAKALIQGNAIINTIDVVDLVALTTDDLLRLLLIVPMASDASEGTTVRTLFKQLFNGKTQTNANFDELVAPYDEAEIPWWKANSYPREFDEGDIKAAGLA